MSRKSDEVKDSPIDSHATVYLDQPSDWARWILRVRLTARRLAVWQFVDPDLPTQPELPIKPDYPLSTDQ